MLKFILAQRTLIILGCKSGKILWANVLFWLFRLVYPAFVAKYTINDPNVITQIGEHFQSHPGVLVPDSPALRGLFEFFPESEGWLTSDRITTANLRQWAQQGKQFVAGNTAETPSELPHPSPSSAVNRK